MCASKNKTGLPTETMRRCIDMNGSTHDSSGEDLDDFCASHYSSAEDSDDFDYDSLLDSLEVTPSPKISNVHEEELPNWDDEGMDRDLDYKHMDPDGNYGEADDSFYVFRGHTGRHYHTGGLTCLSINNNSTIVLTGSNDSTARLVNLSSGKVIRSLFSHSDSVVCCGFAPDTPYTFATGSLDSKLIVWDTMCSAPVCICEHKTGETAEGVTCLLWLAFLPCIITASTHGRVRMWHCVSGTCLQTYRGHQAEIVSFSMTRNYNYIVSISHDRTARVFRFRF